MPSRINCQIKARYKLLQPPTEWIARNLAFGVHECNQCGQFRHCVELLVFGWNLVPGSLRTNKQMHANLKFLIAVE